MKTLKRKSRSDKFPLTLHTTGQYCKKVKGKMYYFGSDRKEALQKYLDQSTYLHGHQEDRALQRCNPSAWSMPEDEREHIINNMLPSSCSSFGLKAINLLSWCAAPIIKIRYIKNSLPVGHMSGLYIRWTSV